MALTINSKTVLRRYDPESKKVLYRLTFDSSYLTGGEELSCVNEFSEIDEVRVESGQGGYLAIPNSATRAAKYAVGKVDLMLYRQTAATGPLVEVPNATDVQTTVLNVIVEGRP